MLFTTAPTLQPNTQICVCCRAIDGIGSIESAGAPKLSFLIVASPAKVIVPVIVMEPPWMEIAPVPSLPVPAMVKLLASVLGLEYPNNAFLLRSRY